MDKARFVLDAFRAHNIPNAYTLCRSRGISGEYMADALRCDGSGKWDVVYSVHKDPTDVAACKLAFRSMDKLKAMAYCMNALGMDWEEVAGIIGGYVLEL